MIGLEATERGHKMICPFPNAEGGTLPIVPQATKDGAMAEFQLLAAPS